MPFDRYAGDWRAVRSTAIRDEVAFIESELDRDGVRNWLNGNGLALSESATEAGGLVLCIDPLGTFSESKAGPSPINWFNSEGVLSHEVEPFNGTLKDCADIAYMLADDVPRWSVHTQQRYGNAVLRYDDGDTKICDRIDLLDDQLIRTMNVVTDELYLDRVVIIYRREMKSVTLDK